MKHIRTLNCIGYSRVAKALLPLFEEIGIEVVGLTNRTPLLTQKHPYEAVWVDDLDRLPKADLWLIAVSDSAIASTALACAAAPNLMPGDVVAHFSGALSDEVLLPVSGLGAHVLSAHPIFTFFDETQLHLPLAFSFSLCGDEVAKQLLKPILKKMGAKTILIERQHKVLYHALCVMASNYIFAYGACLEQLSARVELASYEEVLGPLVMESLKNYKSEGLKRVTGPIARGDWRTVEQHVQALSHISDEMAGLYTAFANVLKASLYPSQKHKDSIQPLESE